MGKGKSKIMDQPLDIFANKKAFTRLRFEEAQSDYLTVMYPTGGILEGQEKIILDELEKPRPELEGKTWFDQIEDQFKVTVNDWRLKFDRTYSVVLILQTAGYLYWDAFQDEEIRALLFQTVQSHFAKRIIRERPLPFATEFQKIPVAAGITCRYVFSEYNAPPIVRPNQVYKIENTTFQHQLKQAIEENNGQFGRTYTKIVRDRYMAAYLEFKFNYQADFDYDKGRIDPIVNALAEVMDQNFRHLRLIPHGKNDVK